MISYFYGRLDEMAGNICPVESSVTPGTNTVGLKNPKVTPPSHSVGVYVEQVGDLSRCQHSVPATIKTHIFPASISKPLFINLDYVFVQTVT